MEKYLRPYSIIANWKMHKTVDEAISFITHVAPIADRVDSNVMIAVPFTAIQPCAEKAEGTKVLIGAQNMNDATQGAFTGEVSASMLKDVGASFVLLGHSERRRIFLERNDFINRKVKRALDSDLKPVLCVGETFDERQDKHTEQVLEKQLTECLQGISKEKSTRIMIAYEPVWAIGTGLAATSETAQEAHAFCRAILAKLFDEEISQKIPIVYGGSVTPENGANFLAEPDIDGLLVGSASLLADSFAKIIELRQNS